jgi:sialate O-acetylesterase
MLNIINAFEQGDIKADDISNWKNRDYNDSRWSIIKAPGFWEGQGLPELDGIVWYRKEVVLTEEQAAKGGVVELAMIDDTDETYVNGVKVGGTHDNYLALRKYPIPAGLLKAGKNVIAIKVTDTGVGGGIHGEAANMQFTTAAGFSQSLAGDWKIKVDTASIQYASISGPNAYPSLLYNAMIAPVIPYTIKGAIWYQGEANAERAYQYRSTFPLMISDWRTRWKEGDFPFYFVQLSSWDASRQNGLKGSQWAELREAQLKTLSLPNTGMAVTTDIGDAKDIHPTNKQDVGLRLALNALNKTYGVNLVPNGPVYRSLVVKGKEAILHFINTGSGLMAKDKYGYLKGFTIAGSDQQFKWAKAVISGDAVIVYSDDVNEPVAVRYGWADDAGDANLYNKEGLPASPFRTDDWKCLTESTKYTIVK